jgi:hypothetical protein
MADTSERRLFEKSADRTMQKGRMSRRSEKKLFETMSVEIVFGFGII